MDEQAASNPKTPPQELTRLAQAPSLQQAIAQNPNAELPTLLWLSNKFPVEVSHNPSLPLALLEKPQLLQMLSKEQVVLFASTEGVAPWLLELILGIKDERIIPALLKQAALTEELLLKLANSRAPLAEVIHHPATNANVLASIIARKTKDLSGLLTKMYLARWEGTPPDTLALLEKDPDLQIQQTLQWRREPRDRSEQRLQVDYATLTNKGNVRSENEDNLWVNVQEERALFVVADGGSGSINTGAIASRVFCEQFAQPLSVSQAPWQILHERFLQGSEEIRRANIQNSFAAAVAVLFAEREATLAYSGDCRIYRLRGEQLSLLTEDHNLPYLIKKEQPLLSEETLQHLPKNVITRFAGEDRVLSVPDISCVEALAGDYFLLCSDGLTSMVPEAEIAAVLQSEQTTQQKTEQLFSLAMEAGGKDNIAIILALVL
jgi:PPM family protein phosphatase